MKSNLLIFNIFFLLLFSCKKDNPSTPTPEPTSPVGNVILHMHTNIDSTEIDSYDSLFGTSEGRKMSLSLAQVYISEIQLIKFDGTSLSVPNKFLKVFNTEKYEISNVPVGNYKSIKFKVGLDPTTNSLDPNNSSYTSILNHNEMWFSTSAQPDGYIFANTQGTIDTSSTLNGSQIPFIYKIGTNQNFTSIEMPIKNYTVIEGYNAYLHITIDYSKIFQDVVLNQISNLSVLSVSDNSLPIAQQLKLNLQSIFSFE